MKRKKVASVFLSHSHCDREFAQKLGRDLRDRGVRVWIDDAEIQVGDSLIEKIRTGIDEMDYLAVILSPAAVSSEWVRREVDIALNQEISGKKVKVLPIMFETCDLPWFLEGKRYADFSKPSMYKSGLNTVLARLDPAYQASDDVIAEPKKVEAYSTIEKVPFDELFENARREIGILTAHAHTLLQLHGKRIERVLSKQKPLRVRVLVLDPKSEMAMMRNAQLGTSYSKSQKLDMVALAKLRDIAATAKALTIRIYDEMPTQTTYFFDQDVIVGPVLSRLQSSNAMHYFLSASDEQVKTTYLSVFDSFWQRARSCK